MTEQLKIFHTILKCVYLNKYNDLGKVNISDNSDINNIKIMVTPYEGIHKNLEYIITLKFTECSRWPLIFIDSNIYDKIKTNQYIKNKGKVGQHKGICIKNLSYGYNFNKYFKILCNNKWENYLYYVITVFNNIEDFKKGNGFKSNYMDLI